MKDFYYRILRSEKNRFGSTNEIAVFSMEENGMKEIKNSSEYFLSEREEKKYRKYGCSYFRRN